MSGSFTPRADSGAYYHYTHGLRKHLGNCQRIAHGHRSRLEIYADGQRSQLTEYQWAKRWRDIYIGTRSDINEQLVINGQPHTDFTMLRLKASSPNAPHPPGLPDRHRLDG